MFGCKHLDFWLESDVPSCIYRVAFDISYYFAKTAYKYK